MASSGELRQISDKVRELRAFQLYYEQVGPPSLLRASHVSHVENKVLILAANNGAVAAKLRQLTPDLLGLFHQHGCEVTGIQVRVQVTLPRGVPVHAPLKLSEEGKHQLGDLAESLAESPLKSALQRLVRGKKG